MAFDFDSSEHVHVLSTASRVNDDSGCCIGIVSHTMQLDSVKHNKNVHASRLILLLFYSFLLLRHSYRSAER